MISMRLGIFLGFLVGGGIATLLLNTKKAEAPGTEQVDLGPYVPQAEPEGVIDKLRHHVREALAAAREGTDEKEAELRRQLDDARRSQ